MTHLQTKLVLWAAIGAFAACSEAPEPDPTLFFASTDTAASRSGLDYADGTQSVEDLEGQEHTVRLVVQTTNTANGSLNEAITDETLTLTVIDDNDFSITLDGETLNFGGGIALRGDGSTLQGGIIGLPGDDLFQAVRLQGSGDELLIGHLITGFETSPDAARLTGGSASYGGGVEGVMNTDTPTNFFGAFTLIADFGNGRIGGDVNLGNVNTDLGTTGLEFDLLPADISGNGFVGELTLVSCSGFATCSTGTEIAGVFYGPNAEGLAGLLTLDLTVSDGMDTAQSSGNAVFGGEIE